MQYPSQNRYLYDAEYNDQFDVQPGMANTAMGGASLPQNTGNITPATTGATDPAGTNLGVIRDYEGKEYDATGLMNLAKQIAPMIDTQTSSGGAFGTKGEGIGFDYGEASRLLGGDATAPQQIILDMARQLMSQGVTDVSQLAAKQYEDLGAPIDESGSQFGPSTQRTGVFAGETMLPEQFGRTFVGKGATGYNVKIDPQTGKPVFSTSGYSTSDRAAIAPLLMMANMALPGISSGLSGALASAAPGALASGSLANQALTNALISGATTKLTGGDFGKGFIRGGLSPVVGAGVGSMIPADFAAANPQLANAIRGVGTGAITAGLTGGDFGQALTSGATSAAINAGMNATLGQIPGYTDLSPAARAAVNQIVGTAIRGGNIDPIRVAISAINAQMAEDAAKARKPRQPGGLASGGAVRGYDDGGYVDGEIYEAGSGSYDDYTDWPGYADFGSVDYSGFGGLTEDQLFNLFKDEYEVGESMETVGERPKPKDPYEKYYENIDIDPEPIEIPKVVGELDPTVFPDSMVEQPDPEPEPEPDPEDPTQCPDGYLYNFNTQSCEKISETPSTQQPRTQPPQPPRSGGLSVAGGSQTNINIPPVQQPAPLTLQTLRNEGGAGGFQDPLARLRDIVGEMRPTSAPAYKMDPYLESLVNQPSKSGYFTYGREPSMDEVFGMGRGFADGGQVESFSHLAAPLMAEGGGHMGGREDFRDGKHVSGPGDGQSDDIPAWLADGEFVFPADVVAALGNGSTKAGTDKLYDMMHNIRKYHRSADPEDLPPEAKKSPLDYLSKGKKGAKA